jgi:hypothetical protein
MKLFTILTIILAVLVGNQFLSQTTLAVGDICVIGIKTNTTTEGGNDAIKLVTLVDLACNTTFIVTDNSWNNIAPGWTCNGDEFGVEITVNTPITAGSVIYIDVDASGGAISSSTGSLSKTSLGGNWGTNFGLNSGGDNVFVLQGTRAAPVFIYGLKHSGAFASITDCTSGGTPRNNTSLPAGLTLGTSAIVMASSQNQWHFNCATNNNTKANLRSAISNNANWVSTAGTKLE